MTIALEATRPPQSHVTVATASLIGTAIEWYDFFLYGCPCRKPNRADN